MAVQFILGRSGTGKTSYCIRAIVDALREPSNRPLILLVPEQASYQAERAILSDKSVSGYSRLNVLSFDRLQFLLLGKNTARPAQLARQIIIHKLLRANSAKLKVFGPVANSIGVARQAAETISELHRYAKTPDDIDRLLTSLSQDQTGNLTALKFADISLILTEYLESIAGKFADPDIQLGRACSAVAGGDFIRNAGLWVDGFAWFTAAELAILAELLQTVAEARIAICLDPAAVDLKNPVCAREHFGLFSPTEQTYAALLEIVRKHKLKLAEPFVLNEPVRFLGCPQLAHIERSLFEPRSPTIPADGNVRIISAPNARAEVQFVAGQILQLVGQQDYRYRDIAVIASSIERYQHYIKAYFDDYSIPFFIDRRKALNQHPVVHLICSALQAVIGGFSHFDVFSCLKSDLVPAPRGDVDLLENYCLACGVSGADWQTEGDWHFAAKGDLDFDEPRINQIRRKLSDFLLKLKDGLGLGDGPPKTVSPRRFTQIVFELLDSIQVRQTLGKWIERACQAGDYPAADEHRQFYDKLVTVFDEIVEVFADEQMTCEDYLALLNSAFSQLTLAFIPPNLDQVLVGSIERSRHPDLKAVFLIGATQRQFPAPITVHGMLTDDDRDIAAAADFTLSANTRQKLAERQYLAYIAFTRPSRALFVTYPLVDDKGSPECRSQFVGNLESLFGGLKEESLAGGQAGIESIQSENELMDLLCSRLGKDRPADPS
ncbi:MAG: PD-(D/E)XK nuclease family protein, partial [Planctomycetota bacterium]